MKYPVQSTGLIAHHRRQYKTPFKSTASVSSALFGGITALSWRLNGLIGEEEGPA